MRMIKSFSAYLAIGADYDGGDWIVLRCACEECEDYEREKNVS
jgi:hypothetical protein